MQDDRRLHCAATTTTTATIASITTTLLQMESKHSMNMYVFQFGMDY